MKSTKVQNPRRTLLHAYCVESCELCQCACAEIGHAIGPDNARDIVRSNKKHILNSDFKKLLSSAKHHRGSAAAAAQIGKHTSWRRLWDVTLDRGVKGTRTMQGIFRELCRPLSCFQCSLCEAEVPTYSSCLEHACTSHPGKMENLSYTHLISLLIDADSADSIFSSCKHVSYNAKLWTFKQ